MALVGRVAPVKVEVVVLVTVIVCPTELLYKDEQFVRLAAVLLVGAVGLEVHTKRL